MSKSDRSVLAAIHEAAHAVSLLEDGCVPQSIAINREGGGAVTTRDDVPASVSARCAVIGGYAVACLYGAVGHAGMSAGDCEDLARAADALGLTYQRALACAEANAGALVATRENEIIALANALLATPHISRDGLAALCRSQGPLNRYAKLFPKPAPSRSPTMRARGGTVKRTHVPLSAEVRRIVFEETGIPVY